MIKLQWTDPPEEYYEDALLVGWYKNTIVSTVKPWDSQTHPYYANYVGGEFCVDSGTMDHSHDKTFDSIAHAQEWAEKRVNYEKHRVKQYIDKYARFLEMDQIEDYLSSLERRRERK